MTTIIYKEPTLIEVIKAIEKLNNKGFTCWIEGRGDTKIKLCIEDNKITIGERQ